jgi:hypothetical protein
MNVRVVVSLLVAAMLFATPAGAQHVPMPQVENQSSKSAIVKHSIPDLTAAPVKTPKPAPKKSAKKTRPVKQQPKHP